MRWVRIAALLALWALQVGVVVLGLYPALPRSAHRWLVLVAAAPAIHVALELSAEKLRRRRAGLRLSANRFPWKRVTVVLLGCIALASLAAAALRL